MLIKFNLNSELKACVLPLLEEKNIKLKNVKRTETQRDSVRENLEKLGGSEIYV